MSGRQYPCFVLDLSIRHISLLLRYMERNSLFAWLTLIFSHHWQSNRLSQLVHWGSKLHSYARLPHVANTNTDHGQGRPPTMTCDVNEHSYNLAVEHRVHMPYRKCTMAVHFTEI